jgi:hypothetical protein
MLKMKTTLMILLGLMLSLSLTPALQAQDVDAVVTPDEAEIEVGGSVKLDVFAFEVGPAERTPVDVTNVDFVVEPDSIGTISDDGFFIAGRNVGTAHITVRIFIGDRIIEKPVVIVIGFLPRPFYDAVIEPARAIVSFGGQQQFTVVVRKPNGATVEPRHVRWDVVPERLGEINEAGLFTARNVEGQTKVIAIVEIDNLRLRAVANVFVSAPATGAITGNVSNDADNSPIAGARVKAVLLGRLHWVVRTETDNLGNYELNDLIPGNYVVFANAAGFIGEFYDDTRLYSEATVLQLEDNETLANIDFGLSEGGKIAGNVIADNDSLPLANAHVVAFLRVNPRVARHAVTGNNGDYLIDALPPGSYAVRANTVGYRAEYFDDVAELDDADLIDIAATETVDSVDFSLGFASAIRGVVTSEHDGSPIAGARVHVFDSPFFRVDLPRFRETRTNEDGEYIVQLRPGQYYVFATADGFNGEFFDDTQNLKEAELVPVAADSHTTGIDLALTRRGSISGTVTDESTSQPIIGAVVEAFSETPLINFANTVAGFRARTDSSGNYTIDNVPAGKYLVLAHKDNYLPEFFEEAASKDSADLVVVEDNANVADVDFTLERGGSISGLVASENDSLPIAGALVKVFASNSRRHLRAYTGNNGEYRVDGLPSGVYFVQVIARGFFSEFYNNARGLGQATPVNVTAPDETAGIDVYLEPKERRRGTIAGSVISDADETPIFGAVVIAVRPSLRVPHITFSDPDGNYELTDLAPGRYFVFAWAEGFIGEFYQNAPAFRFADVVMVENNQTTSGIDFDLVPREQTGIYIVRGKINATPSGNGIAMDRPLEGALVHAKINDEIAANAVTDANGEYAFFDLPAGTYEIEATAAGYSDANFSAEVVVGEGQDAEDVNLTMIEDNITDVGSDDGSLPSRFSLSQNYPNPFNPETTIKYQLAQTSEVALKIFNILGQQVRTLVNKQQVAGTYSVQWDGNDDVGRQVASGIYVFQISAGDAFRTSKRMLLLR